MHWTMSENSCETRLKAARKVEKRWEEMRIVSKKSRGDGNTEALKKQDDDECAEQSCEAVILRASSYRQNLCFDPIVLSFSSFGNFRPQLARELVVAGRAKH